MTVPQTFLPAIATQWETNVQRETISPPPFQGHQHVLETFHRGVPASAGVNSLCVFQNRSDYVINLSPLKLNAIKRDIKTLVAHMGNLCIDAL
eukprot:1138503-Pelagomonas_calceolata.AAC.5